MRRKTWTRVPHIPDGRIGNGNKVKRTSRKTQPKKDFHIYTTLAATRETPPSTNRQTSNRPWGNKRTQTNLYSSLATFPSP